MPCSRGGLAHHYPPRHRTHIHFLSGEEREKKKCSLFRCYLFICFSVLEMVGTTTQTVWWWESVGEAAEVTAAVSGSDPFFVLSSPFGPRRPGGGYGVPAGRPSVRGPLCVE